MKSLKYLMLDGCDNLEEFLLSSEEMRRLMLVNTGIKTLKLPIGRFNKLEELYLGGNLRSFQINEPSYLTALKKIFLFNFSGRLIRKSNLLTLFDVWRSLNELYLRHCEVYWIPDNISAMSRLRTLSLRGCQVEGLPNSIKHLSQLRELDLGECKQLRSLPELPPSITHFYVDECTSLETIGFKVMRTLYNNYSSEVKVCYPGSTIPKGFKYSRMAERFITIELAPSSSDHLLGFASCCVLAISDIYYLSTPMRRKLHFEDEEIYCKDEEKFLGFVAGNGRNVYLWYDPMESILQETQRSFKGATTYKFTCEFFVGDLFRNCDLKLDDFAINECGIWPIYASDLQEEVVQQMELKLENRITK